jgi:hypothetical protein
LVLSDGDQRGDQPPADQPVGESEEENKESKIELDELESPLCLDESVVAKQLLLASTGRTDEESAYPPEPLLHGHDCARAPPKLSC